MSSALHSKQTADDGIHTPISYVYANAAARTGATGFVAADVTKMALQSDDNTVWLLYGVTPDWALVGPPSNRLLPAGGLDGYVLSKNSATDYDAIWELNPAPNRLIPPGGPDGYVLSKTSGADYEVAWESPDGLMASNGLPSGGTTGEYLQKASGTDFDAQWAQGAAPFDGYTHNYPRSRDLYYTSYVAVREDFMGQGTDQNYAFTQQISGTGAGNDTINSPVGRCGVIRTQTGTDTGGRCSYYLSITSSLIIAGGGVEYNYEAVIRPSAKSDGTDAFVLVLGLNNTVGSGVHVHGCGLMIDHTINANNWILNSTNQNSTTNVDSGIEIVADQWYHFRMTINAAATNIGYFIDGVNCGNITTDIPTGTAPWATGMNPNWRIFKSAGTTSRWIDVDFLSLRIDRQREVILP